MNDKKLVPDSDEARTGENADKNREELSKVAEKGLRNTRENDPKGDAL